MTSQREMSFILAAPERKLLRAIAARLPRWVTPNHLTAFGILGALGTAVGYALAGRDPAWLWLASAMLAVNWFGDSLDGTLARVRQIERPKYGYYLDHIVDAFNTAVVGAGIGMSPYASIEVALALVIVYLTLSINVYLESKVFDVFDMGYGVFGPTEVRILLILANATAFGAPALLGVTHAAVQGVSNWVLAGITALMVLVLAIRFVKNLRRLSRMEPRRR